MSRTAPHTFSSKSNSQSSWDTSSKGLAIDWPALLTRMSTRPNLSSVVCTMLLAESGSITSADMGSTWPSVAVMISCAASSSTSGRRATMTTAAPSLAMLRAARLADAVAAAGDDGYLVLQTQVHVALSRVA